MKKPDVVMIVVDCLRAESLFGDRRSASAPAIDRLADRGAVCTSVITQQNLTAPCFASLLTGTYSSRHRLKCQLGFKLSDSVTSLAEIFRANGYHTRAEVTGPLHSIYGLDRGFDTYHYRKTSEFFDRSFADSLLGQLDERADGAPNFLLLHLWDIHAPRKVEKSFDDLRYGADEYDRAISSLDAHLGYFIEALGEERVVILTGDHGEKLPADGLEPGTALPYFSDKLDLDAFSLWNHISPDFFFNVQLRTVHWMGQHSPKSMRDKFLQFYFATEKAMSDKRLSNRTKMYLRVNRNEGHGMHLYDYLCRVPLIMAGGDHFAGGVRQGRQVRQVDILPTIVEALELETGEANGHDGTSLGPLLRGEEYSEQPALLEVFGTVVAEEIFSLAGVRTSEYKYIFSPGDPECPEELYDLKADPMERSNIAPSMPDVREDMASLYGLCASQSASLEETSMSVDEEAVLTEKLRALGYID
ncbi:sulfatase [Thermodesulfobacteriota bacterium]